MLFNTESFLSSLYKHAPLYGQNTSAHFSIFQSVFQFFPLIFNTNRGAGCFCHQVSLPAAGAAGPLATGSDVPCTELFQT